MTWVCLNAVQLRPYRDADLAAVVALWYRAWHAAVPGISHPQPYDLWTARFRDEIARRETVWVADSVEHVVGFIALDAARGVLDQIFVETAVQGAGVGAMLLTKAKELSPAGLHLQTLAQNAPARRFYERHGFLPGAISVNPVNGLPSISYNWKPRAW